jgi:hypothetical protein
LVAIAALAGAGSRRYATASAGGTNVPVDSQYDLAIVYPRPAGTAPDLDSNNRCFFAYTGLTYEIPLVAGWGAYPYTWEVSGGESGKFSVVEYTMASGMPGYLLRYTNPQVADDASITLLCTDSLSATDTVSYSITVGTSGWFFLDGSVDGTGDTGTAAAPFDTLLQAHTSMTANSRLYIRAGTYTFAGISTTNPSGLPAGAQGSEMRIDWNQATRGTTWIAYPGDAQPVIDFEFNNVAPDPSTGYASPVPRIRMNGGALASIGIAYSRPMVMAFQLQRSGNHGVLFWRNSVDDGGPSTGLGDNASYFMTTANYGGGGTPGTQASGDCFISNTLTNSNGTNNPGAIKMYSGLKTVLEGNYMDGFDNDEVMALKADNSQFFAVANRFGTGTGIGGNFDSHNVGEESYGDICYNWFEPDSFGLLIGGNRVDDFIGRIDVYRDSLSDILIQNLQTTDGPWVLTKNAIQNAQGAAAPWPYITDSAIADSSRLTYGDNLDGAAGIFDATGNLVDPQYSGIYGHTIP